MSTDGHFPRTRGAASPIRLATFAVALIVAAVVQPRAASAENLVLAGPHPMRKANTLALHLVSGDGFGDSFSGRGFGLEYGYMLQGPLWLDLQATYRASACSLFRACGMHTGDSAELLVGLAWRFRTDIPLVPYLRGAAGLLFLYPDRFQNAMGVAVRGGGGLRYYLYDWLGFGAELGMTLGHASFTDEYTGDSTHFLGDLSANVEFQFD